MDISKLHDAISELEAEAERCKRLASDLRAVIQRSANGSRPAAGDKPAAVPQRVQPRLKLRHRDEKSVRTLALELLRSQQKPLHVDELVTLINAERNEKTNRAAVESQLVRAIKRGSHGVRRAAPGTYIVGQL